MIPLEAGMDVAWGRRPEEFAQPILGAGTRPADVAPVEVDFQHDERSVASGLLPSDEDPPISPEKRLEPTLMALLDEEEVLTRVVIEA